METNKNKCSTRILNLTVSFEMFETAVYNIRDLGHPRPLVSSRVVGIRR